MADFITETGVMIPQACPTCEPTRDPFAYDVRYCTEHEPRREGLDDAAVRSEAYLSGSGEAGGEDNRRWCQLLHRQ